MLISLAPADGEAILPLEKLKARVRVTHGAEDVDIGRMRLQAIDFVERYSEKALGRRQFQWLDKQFACAMGLPVGPVASVDAVTYFDGSGTEIELASAAWRLGGDVLLPAAGSRWPYAGGLPGNVQITFTAGYEDAETEAPMLIAAVEVAVASLFEDRESPDFGPAKALIEQAGYRDASI